MTDVRRDRPDVGDVIELSDDAVVVVWTEETICVLDLRAEMAEDHDRWLIWSDQK